MGCRLLAGGPFCLGLGSAALLLCLDFYRFTGLEKQFTEIELSRSKLILHIQKYSRLFILREYCLFAAI